MFNKFRVGSRTESRTLISRSRIVIRNKIISDPQQWYISTIPFIPSKIYFFFEKPVIKKIFNNLPEQRVSVLVGMIGTKYRYN